MTSEERSKWTIAIEQFAKAISKSTEEVVAALTPMIGEPGDTALELLGDEQYTPIAEIAAALRDVPSARLKKAVADNLRKKVQAATLATTTMNSNTFAALPPVPDDEAWLTALKTGGELKVDANTVTSGMRAAIAERTGLFDLPAKLVEKMEAYADSLEEPVGSEFFRLRKLLVRRNYSEVFEALDIEGGGFATQKRKDAFIVRVHETLWPALLGFQTALQGWTRSWQDSLGNPAAMMTLVLSGARGGTLPPGVMQPPATDSLRDAAEAVVNHVNRVFSGVGIPTAAAMAYDAMNVKKVLETPNLPAMVGAANREQMLKMLRADVQADYVRLERNVIQYALGVMEFSKVTADAELGYLTSLHLLGSQIPWDRLGAPVARRGSARAAADNDPFARGDR